MALKYCILLSLVAYVAAQNPYRVCVSQSAQCQSLELGDSRLVCTPVESRIDCALRLARNEADIGYFTDEELLVLSAVQSNDLRVVASIRDNTKLQDPVAFEAVAVVPNTHTNGLQGLKGVKYCHPGLGEPTFRWSPRVEKQLEFSAAETDRCPNADTQGKTAEEMEVAKLSEFFGDSCRPGLWSPNATLDAELKSRYPALCALCGAGSTCLDYTIDMGVTVANVNNNNAHIKSLECLRSNGNGTVAYVAWQHVREFFNTRNPDLITSYSILCPSGDMVQLSQAVLGVSTAPCAFVRQPWSAIVASIPRATDIQNDLRTWWPSQALPNDGTWRSTLFSVLVPSPDARVSFEELVSPANYTAPVRTIANIDSALRCLPQRRWCTVSTAEQQKCMWVRSAAYVLGIEPSISCVQRSNEYDCLRAVSDSAADFVTSAANYGYIARQYFKLTPVKLLQNQRSNTNSFSRVIALLKNSTVSEVSRFENLKDKKACFPEFGGISYVAFVEAARNNKVLSATECDYAKVVGEFFQGACAPGATDAAHAISETTYDATPLCTACRSTNATTNFTCDWNYASNLYFGNNGSVSCLNNSDAHVAFVETQNLPAILTQLGLDANQFRVLCRNNTLAVNTGVIVDDDCLLAFVVDSEVLTRRGSFVRPKPPVKPNDPNTPPPSLRPKYVHDPIYNSLSSLLDTLEKYFGYAVASLATNTQHVNLEIFSPFDGTNDLLFKNTATGFSEPTSTAANVQAKNYVELFQHLQTCTGAGSNIPVPGLANRSFYSIVTLIMSALVTKFIVY